MGKSLIWRDFITSFPRKYSDIIVLHEGKIYCAFTEELDMVFVFNDLIDDNVTGMLWKIDWDLGGFLWVYKDELIHEITKINSNMRI